MSEFSGDDYDFALGSVLGMRSWAMDSKGRLTGVTHKAVWLPGENVSTCKVDQRQPCPEVAKGQVRTDGGVVSSRPLPCGCGLPDAVAMGGIDPQSLEPCGEHPDCHDGTHPADNPHTFDPGCQCGFWAYDEHSFSEHGEVVGIVEGYGKTTIGTRGFRCEKARIVALCRERDEGLLTLSGWLRLQQLYPAAKFYEEQDEMVSHHGAVLRQWSDASAEGFWDQPAEPPRSSAAASLWGAYSHQISRSLNHSMMRALANPPLPPLSRGGLLGRWSQP